MISNKEGLGPKLKKILTKMIFLQFWVKSGQFLAKMVKNDTRASVYKVDTILANIRSWGYSTFFGGDVTP